jgi:hypothetical protein
MSSGADGPKILYKSPHFEQPVELPASEVSTLFFAKAAAALPEPKSPWQLGLHGRGSLRVASCSFGGDTLSAEHPLLGKLEIRRDAINSLERKAGDPDDESEPEPEEGAEEEE